MTDLLSPEDTGEIAVGEGTRDLTRYYKAPLRSPLPRPDVADTAEVELPAREGMVLADMPTMRVAHFDPAVTVADVVPGLAFQPAQIMPEPETVKPVGGRGRHRGKGRAPAPWWAWALVGAGTALPFGAVLGIAILWAVTR